jgi:hypothetical protein
MAVERTLAERVYVQVMNTDPQRVDRSLPAWARRSHPIVRYGLGVFRKVLTPDLLTPVRLYLVQAAVVLASFALPGLFNLLLPVVTVPMVLLPVGFYFYAETLHRIGAHAATLVADAVKCKRFDLLRVTPMSLEDILAAKGSAAIWRYIETLDLILLSAALLTLPMLILEYASYYPPTIYPVVTRLLMIGGFAACLLRIVLEPIMIASLGLLMGGAIGMRIPAVLATSALGFAYFILINLPRLLLLSPMERFLVEILLPLALPPLITIAALRLAVRLLSRD